MPYATRHPKTAEDLIVGIAGQKMGLLVDDIATFEAVGGVIRNGTAGRAWAIVDKGRAYPLTCGDIVERPSEDGPYTDRCGAMVAPGEGACEGHQAAIDAWRNMTEAEKREVEEREAEMDMYYAH